MFVQRSEFNSGKRIALYKNYLLLLDVSVFIENIGSELPARIFLLKIHSLLAAVNKVFVEFFVSELWPVI